MRSGVTSVSMSVWHSQYYCIYHWYVAWCFFFFWHSFFRCYHSLFLWLYAEYYCNASTGQPCEYLEEILSVMAPDNGVGTSAGIKGPGRRCWWHFVWKFTVHHSYCETSLLLPRTSWTVLYARLGSLSPLCGGIAIQDVGLDEHLVWKFITCTLLPSECFWHYLQQSRSYRGVGSFKTLPPRQYVVER